jgi:hypothetical protein
MNCAATTMVVASIGQTAQRSEVVAESSIFLPTGSVDRYLVGLVGITVLKVNLAISQHLEIRMPSHSAELPKTGFSIEIDGRLKTEFTTKEGAEQGAVELKRRFPMLQVRIYDAAAQTRHEVRA